MERELEPYQRVERSIQKKFRKSIWVPFIAAVKRYELIQENDKIAVCISGGKDSMLMAKLLQELQKYSEVPFELVYLVMDPGYNELNRKKIESNAALLHIPITIFETDIFLWQQHRKEPVLFVCKSAADIYTAKRSRSAATRSHLDIISVTLWKPL